MMFLRPLIVAAAGILAACGRPAPVTTPGPDEGPPLPQRVAPRFPPRWEYRAGGRAPFARHAMVASNDRLASAAGVEILNQGGNAIDAAVAVGFALAVTHPEAGNIGGGGYMIIRLADGRAAALDYREVAPLGAFRDMYLDAEGAVTEASLVGHLASGVPGSVMGLTEALARFGTMPLQRVIAPAIRLAERGFIVDSNLSRSIQAERRLIARFAGASKFLPLGEPLTAGMLLRQPELARTLRLIAGDGARAFYEGEIADLIVAEMRRGGGIITREDLARYRAEWREPVRTTYRGHTLIAMPPSSSGGVTIAQTLNILETYASLPGFGTAPYLHRLASAYQLAFLDRNAKLADPAFVDVPIAELTSKAYAHALRARIVDDRATPTGAIAEVARQGTHTTHYSVVDRDGNAVATTTTINGLYGSGVYVPEAGFFLNNEMDDFAARPGMPNQFGLVQGEQNAIAPRKRMLSAMSPTIVLDPADQLLLVVGSRGGPRIITSTSQVILNVVQHRMSLSDAVSAPRIHHQAFPDTIYYERDGMTPEAMAELAAMGHALAPYGAIGRVIAIMRVPGGYEGMVDPRSYGGVVGH